MPKKRPTATATPKASTTEYGCTTGWTPTILNRLPIEPDEHAGEAAEHREQDGLDEELADDVGAPRADRLADADLAGSLGDR